jgi:hypothetical protein
MCYIIRLRKSARRKRKMNEKIKKVVAAITGAAMILSCIPCVASAKTESEEIDVTALYEKGNFATSYNEIVSRKSNSSSRAWRDGMVSGNGEVGYVTSGSPYSDTFIFQHMYFNYPSSQPREIPEELTGQLEDARLNVFNLNDKWEVKAADGTKRHRTFYYSFHPGHQLRLTSAYNDNQKNYVRWTNYETAETGVEYTDKYGKWTRKSFTSREDGVSITKIEKSSEGQLINMTISIDDISDMCKAYDSMSAVTAQRYKKIVPDDCRYIAQIAHYPAYDGSELYDGGYGGVTRVVVEGENAKKTRVVSASDESMLVGDNASIKIENAEAVYLITSSDRTFEMTGSTGDVMSAFSKMNSYTLLEELEEKTNEVVTKYTADGKFSYEAALKPSAKLQSEEFNRVSFNLEGDEEYSSYDNNALISEQRKNTKRINHEFMRRAYEQARYAEICCSGTSAPRLYAMWTGEWNPGWRGIYTLDANVNLQVSPMNTGNLTYSQEGYITFFLRHAPDFMYNAQMAYGMHDAIQVSVNADADREMHVEYDNSYPFQYWNAGASWCLLPIYEYWQCFGNRKIEINDYMRFDNLQSVLGVEDGGLSDEEFNAIKERGYLDLEEDILLPLLTKQANFWEQIVTPRYYTDVNGTACHDESKTELNEGEKYIIIPTYSPENSPVGYNSTITANATMDIAAARDGLDMVCAMEKAVGRDGWEEAVEKWTKLKNSISDYKYDSDGALREWAMSEYTENNNHRHLSHLYVAWPAYETQNNPSLAEAANIALDNRNRYNTGDATAGHGWMHKALVEARLKRGDGMMKSLLKMMNGTAYYSSFMTDHDTNRRNDTYCTDTAFGTVGAVNEAVVFSNTGEIEIIPALPKDWTKGEVEGLMARTQAEIENLSWSIDDGKASVSIRSAKDDNLIRLSCGEAWTKASIGGKALDVKSDERGKFVEITLSENEAQTVEFELSKLTDGTYTIEKDSKFLNVKSIENNSEAIWGELGENSYWSIENNENNLVTIRSCATGKYLTNDNGTLVQKNYTGEDSQLWSGDEFTFNRLTELKDVVVTPDSVKITADGEEAESVTAKAGETISLDVVTEPEGAKTSMTYSSDSIGNGVVTSDGKLTLYTPGSFTVTATSTEGYSVSLPVTVTGEDRAIVKAKVKAVTASDDGYSSAWLPKFAFDGITDTAYASKDDSNVKFLQAELERASAITYIYITGRYTASDGNGKYANRINGALVYASNSPMTSDLKNATLVGEVSSVTATSAYTPTAVEVNTDGKEYKYYLIYFDSVNNGSAISMAVGDVDFYTGGGNSLKKLSPTCTAEGGTGEEYAVDSDQSTAFVITGQKESEFKNQYILFEFDKPEKLNKIVIKKKISTLGGNTTYWGDHAYAVGCVLEGSLDGETWDTVAVMNTKPDGTDSDSEVKILLSGEEEYKYIRYIRREKNSYISWAADSGNRLMLADIEFYTLIPEVLFQISYEEDGVISVDAKSNKSGEYKMVTAIYSEDNTLLSVSLKNVSLTSSESETIKTKGSLGKTKIFFWTDSFEPVSESIAA